MYHILKSVAIHHFKINESSVRTGFFLKEIHEVIAAAIPADVKTLYFLWNAFLSCVENAAVNVGAGLL